jgi:glucan phosphoethanolaminetransferase (alkaline phosphatase superfamily)
MSYEYLMQAVLLIFLVVITFFAMLIWTKWRKRGRR